MEHPPYFFNYMEQELDSSFQTAFFPPLDDLEPRQLNFDTSPSFYDTQNVSFDSIASFEATPPQEI